MLWNQKGTDIGSLLFARMAASYNKFSSYRRLKRCWDFLQLNLLDIVWQRIGVICRRGQFRLLARQG